MGHGLDMCFYGGCVAYSFLQALKPEGVAACFLTMITVFGLDFVLDGDYKLPLLAAISCIAAVTKFVSCYIFRGPKNIKKFGEWAVITGSTDGIGKAMAIFYAKKGLNIVLISRTQRKLNAVAKEVEAAGQAGCLVETLAIDFAEFNEDQQKAVSEIGQKHDIRILINNVGMSYPHAMYYHETTIEMQQKLLRINCDSMAVMTHLLLPTMQKKKSGFVVNISSGASVLPHDLYVGYAACKAYVNKFTEDMNREYNGSGIYFQCQIPLFVASKMSKLRRSSLTVASPNQYARACHNHFGHPGLVSPFFMHALILQFIDFVPSYFTSSLVTSMHHNIRKRALRKAQKKAASAKEE